MLSRTLSFVGLSAAIGASAQTVVFTEEFETAGAPSISPGWIWDGDAPVVTPACQYGNWSVTKDVHGPMDSLWGFWGSHWLFHPLPYEPLMRYSVSANGAVANFGDSVSLYASVIWWDPAQGNPFMGGFGDFTHIFFCDEHNPPYYYADVQPLGLPNAQFGVLIYAFTWSNVDLILDHVVVRTKPYKAQFAGSMLLGGPYDPVTQTMHDDLRQQGLIPLTEPYTALGWPQFSGGGGETTTPAVLNATYTGGHVVDWVRLELRDHNDPTQIVATRQALVLQNGTVINAAGGLGALFDIFPGAYYVAVRHRNHLGAMTFASYQVVYPGGGVWTYNFAEASFPSYGTEGKHIIGSKAVLWEGNAAPNAVLDYVGPGNDRDAVLTAIGGVVPTNTVSGYLTEDVTMDGIVKYVGTNNDRDRILLNIGGINPVNTRPEQIP